MKSTSSTNSSFNKGTTLSTSNTNSKETLESKRKQAASVIELVSSVLAASPGARLQTNTEKLMAAQEPALFVSAKQLASLADPSHATAGSYLPARKTRAGLFTMALYTAPQPAPAPLSESEYKRGYRDGYDRRDAEVQGALV